MPTPPEVDQSFQNLTYLLSFPATGFHQLRLIADFIRSLGSETAAYEPYLLQIAERVPKIVGTLPPSGFAPDDIENVLGPLKSLEGALSDPKAVAGFDRAVQSVQDRAVGSALYAGDIERAARLLGTVTEKKSAARAQSGSHGSRRSEIRAAVRDITASHPEVSAGIQRALDSWAQQLSPPPNSVYVPVVERATMQASGPIMYATLTRATMVPGEDSSAIADTLHSGGAELAGPALAAARALALEKSRRRKRHELSCILRFEPRSALQAGSPANLAIAALFYCAILQDPDLRIRYRIRPDVAITGDIRADGTVYPLDAEALSEETRTAFYSHIETFVVPKDQLSVAEKTIADLRSRFPGRSLSIVGVSHLREIFLYHRVVDQTSMPAARYAARYLLRNRIVAGAVVVIAAMLIVLGRALYTRTESNPVAAEWAGGKMLIKNSRGEVFWEIPVGNETVRQATLTAQSGLPLKTVLFADVNGDRRNEILYVRRSRSVVGGSDSLFCCEAGRPRPLWAISAARKLAFPQRQDIESSDFTISDIECEDLEGNGTLSVIAAANNRPSFPGVVLQLNARNGRETGAYVNIGHITDVTSADLDGDGSKEILACGVNDAYQAAALFVLDPRRMSGYSPTRGTYEPARMQRGMEMAYCLIPRTVVGQQFLDRSGSNIALVLDLLPDEKLAVTVDDVAALDPQTGKSIMAGIMVTFSYSLQLQRIGSQSDYDTLAVKLFKSGRIPSLPDAAYFAKFASEVMMWHGDQFQKIATRGIENR